MRRALAAVVLVCLAVGQAGATQIYDNGTPDLVNAYLSDFDPTQSGTVYQIADDFVLPSASRIEDVHWWGVYAWGDLVPPAEDDFTIRIFEMSGTSVPPSPSHEIHLGDPGRTDTGSNLQSGKDLYYYSAQFPGISVAPGTYALSIVNNTVGDDDAWYWATSLAGSGTAWSRSVDGDGWGTLPWPNEFAFQLTGVVIPEPMTLTLLAGGLVVLAVHRRRRK